MLTFHYECVSQLETKIVQSFIHVDVWFFHLFSALNASNPLNLGLNFNINVKFVCHRLQNGMLLLNSGCMEVIKMGPYNYQLTDYLIRGLT